MTNMQKYQLIFQDDSFLLLRILFGGRGKMKVFREFSDRIPTLSGEI